MRKIYLAITLIAQIGFSQAPAIQWHKCIGGTSIDVANGIQQTTDGGYIVVGSTKSTNGDVTGIHGLYDYWVVKLSNTGTIQWQKALGGTGYDYGYSIQQTTDGGYLVAGTSNSSDGDRTGNYLNDDVWLIKLSSGGAIQWQKTLGGNGDDNAACLQQTTDGGFVLVAYSNSTDGDVTGSHGFADYWVVKLTNTGTIQWQKTLGGNGSDTAKSIQQTTDGGYIIAGNTDSTNGDVTGQHGFTDYWIVKLTSTGTLQWQKTLGGSHDEDCYSIQQTTDGGYIVAGSTISIDGDVTGNYGNDDYWIVKLSSTGAIQWQKILGGSGNDYAYNIKQTADGNYIVAGNSPSTNQDVTGNLGGFDAWIVKLNSSGAIQWQKTIGGSGFDSTQCIQQTTDGGFVLVGHSESTDGDVTGNHGNSDFWVVKLSPEALSNVSFDTNQIKIFPNPTRATLTLQDTNNFSFDKIIIYDLAGKKMLEQVQSRTQINVEQLASGMYILKAFSGELQLMSKFVKE